MKRYENMTNIIIDNDKCILCKKCIEKCPFNSLKQASNHIEVLDNCRVCLQCKEVCPVDAIKQRESVRHTVKKEDWKGILVYAEYHNKTIHPITYQLIGKAYELARTIGYDVYGIVIGKSVDFSVSQLKNYPLKEVFLYETDDEYFKSDLYEKLLSNCISAVKPSVVLMGGTAQGRSLAPRAATEFRSGLTADCTDLKLRENSDLVQIRPAFGGNIMAQIVTTDTRPQFATVRYNVMSPLEAVFNNKTKFITCDNIAKASSKLEILEALPKPKVKGITDQERLVVAGKGVKKKEDLDMLEELAALIGGELASTRGLVEKGWMTNDRQIGLSGQTVRPKLLITCGVSGSVQFIAGMKGVDNIVAINIDPYAKIFNIAHYPICGDLYEIVPELIKLIRRSELY